VILAETRKILRGEGKQGRRPHLWDGKAAERIVDVLTKEIRAQG
jgi:UDP-N-acetylglucosamine 2-epimerase (non-hydrolysing)